MAALKAMPGTLNLRSDWQNKVLKAKVLVDQARASRAQISSRSVAYSLESHIDGVKVTEYREEDVAIPVTLQSADEERQSFGDLGNVSVYSPLRGANVPIMQIATGKGKWEFDRISRWNQERTLTTELVHETLKAPQLLSAIEPLMQDLQLKEGYRWEVGGELETREETIGKIARNMPFCIFGIIVLLVWQFNSFRRPGIILFTIFQPTQIGLANVGTFSYLIAGCTTLFEHLVKGFGEITAIYALVHVGSPLFYSIGIHYY